VKQQIQLRRREAVDGVDFPADLPPLLQRLYASRGVRSAQDLERSVKGMLPWQQLTASKKRSRCSITRSEKGCVLWWSVILTPTAQPAPR
jgi:single-stranded-DNA-specific exonuclease